MAKVLCIDDQPIGLSTRKLLLETKGYEVLIASSGQEGLDLLAANDIAAVIVDYSMPEMNGEQVAHIMRNRWPNVRIIMLSGYPDVPQSVIESADAFIVKGTPPTTLLDQLQRLVGQRPETRFISPALEHSRQLKMTTTENMARSHELRRRRKR